MLTADTITDEQIRELRDNAAKTSGAERISNPNAMIIRDSCWALGDSCWFAGIDCRIPHGLEAVYGRDARARCAEILNARDR
jgi:hypothetical protein